MKNLKNKKILFILVAFLFCLFVFSGSSKATFDFTYNDTNYSLPDLPSDVSNKDNFLIIQNSVGEFYLFFTASDYPIYAKVFDSSTYYFYPVSDVYFCLYIFSPSDSQNSWKFHTSQYSKNLLFDVSKFHYFNSDIYTDKNLSDVLFQGAPKKVTEAVEIPTIQNPQQIPETIVKVVKMIIPVCLVILATLLIISLIQSVIYRIH